MKNYKQTLRMAKLAIKLQPFFLFYTVIHSFLSIISLLFPIGLIWIIVGYYDKGADFKYVVYTCIAFALGFYLINIIYFYLGKLYRKNFRYFCVKYETLIFNKLKEIDYDVYQSSAFLNDYTRAIDEGHLIVINCFWSLSDVISAVLGLTTIFTIFATLSPIIIVYAVVVGIIFYFISKINAKIWWNLTEIQKQNYRERGYIKRLFYLKDSSQDIRTSNVKDLFLDINDEVGTRVIRNTDKYLSKRSILATISNFLVRSIYPFSLAFLAYMTIESLNFVGFVALTVAASRLSDFIWRLSDSLSWLETQAALSEAVVKVLDKTGVVETSGSKEVDTLYELKVENCNFGYQENKMILKDVNIKIKKGEKIAIVGENGAGKTTLVKLLLRLYDVNEGKIFYNNEDYKDIYPTSIRKRIGAVFQDFEIYAFSIAENVLLRKIQNEDDISLVMESLKFSGLYDKVKTFEKGIDTNITKEFDETGIELSGGEKQKLVIARAYAGNYDLIILDEPNSALDPIAEAEIYEKMMKLGKDRTLIFISHRLSTTIKANRIYLFDDGRIIESGTHSDLMNIKDGKYHYMFNIQAQKYVDGSNDL